MAARREEAFTEAPSAGRKTLRFGIGVVLVVALVVALGCAGLLGTRYKLFAVNGESMQPTFYTGDMLVVRKEVGTIQRGDVVILGEGVWTGPKAPEADQVKRVLAVAGDQVACCDAKGRANLAQADNGNQQIITVPAGRLFMVGDNPDMSTDSRAHLDVAGGTVEASGVVGKVAAVAWPLSHKQSVVDGGQPLALLVGAVLGALIALAAGITGSLMDQRTPDPAVLARRRPPSSSKKPDDTLRRRTRR